MSTSDTLTLVQTLFALLTCVLLFWYILITRKLQKQAQEQNRLQKEQLAVAKQELSQALFRERNLLVPCIRWKGGLSGVNEEKWDFENVGADVRNIRWSSDSSVQVDYEPRHLIRTFDQGSIRFSAGEQPLPYPLRFSLAFNNQLDDLCTRHFEICGAGKEPKEVTPYQA